MASFQKKGSHHSGDCLRELYSVFITPGLRVIYLFLTSTAGAAGITTGVTGTAPGIT